MFPLILDLSRVKLVVVGDGYLLTKRLKQLDEAGAKAVTVFAPNPCHCVRETAGNRWVHRLPTAAELVDAHVVYIVDLPSQTARSLADQARAAGTLVNVEDDIPYCDFHTPTVLRRGDLLFTVSTAGKSPGLAQRLRQYLGDLFGPEWGERLDRVARARQQWRSAGLGMTAVAARTREMIEREKWL